MTSGFSCGDGAGGDASGPLAGTADDIAAADVGAPAGASGTTIVDTVTGGVVDDVVGVRGGIGFTSSRQ